MCCVLCVVCRGLIPDEGAAKRMLPALGPVPKKHSEGIPESPPSLILDDVVPGKHLKRPSQLADETLICTTSAKRRV